MTGEAARRPFGRSPDGTQVELFTLRNGPLEAAIVTWGAALQQLLAPDRDGAPANVVLGFGTLDGYVQGEGHSFGATVGRYANRIGGGRFELDGVVHELPQNEGTSSLHGGTRGFDRHVWEVADVGDARVALRLTSPDRDMGYPGTLTLEVEYVLEDWGLRLDYRATTDAPTVLNPTNHTCWQLAGEGTGPIDDHVLTLAASRYVAIDASLLPTGELAAVEGTPLDFRAPLPVGARLRDGFEQVALARGYDHCFVVDRDDTNALVLAARLEEPTSGRVLEVLTTEPGLQVYTGNFLDGTLYGTGGRAYRQGDCIAFETQHFPDSPNVPQFPSTVLRPGERFRSTTVFRFPAPS